MYYYIWLVKHLVSEQSVFLPFGPPKREVVTSDLFCLKHEAIMHKKPLTRSIFSLQMYDAVVPVRYSVHLVAASVPNTSQWMFSTTGAAATLLRVGESTYSTARPLYTAKMPLSNILLHSCRVACSSHPTLLEMHINQSACESRRTCFLSVSLFFHLFAVSCMNVLPGDPVKGKAALPRFGVYEGHGWLCHHDRAVVSFCAVPGCIFSLHPCPRHCIRLPIQTTIIFLFFFP